MAMTPQQIEALARDLIAAGVGGGITDEAARQQALIEFLTYTQEHHPEYFAQLTQGYTPGQGASGLTALVQEAGAYSTAYQAYTRTDNPDTQAMLNYQQQLTQHATTSLQSAGWIIIPADEMDDWNRFASDVNAINGNNNALPHMEAGQPYVALSPETYAAAMGGIPYDHSHTGTVRADLEALPVLTGLPATQSFLSSLAAPSVAAAGTFVITPEQADEWNRLASNINSITGGEPELPKIGPGQPYITVNMAEFEQAVGQVPVNHSYATTVRDNMTAIPAPNPLAGSQAAVNFVNSTTPGQPPPEGHFAISREEREEWNDLVSNINTITGGNLPKMLPDDQNFFVSDADFSAALGGIPLDHTFLQEIVASLRSLFGQDSPEAATLEENAAEYQNSVTISEESAAAITTQMQAALAGMDAGRRDAIMAGLQTVMADGVIREGELEAQLGLEDAAQLMETVRQISVNGTLDNANEVTATVTAINAAVQSNTPELP